MIRRAALALLVLAASAGAVPPAAPRVLPGADVEFKAADGWTLKGKYEAARSSSTTFILLHGAGQRKEVWFTLARYLRKAGYGYLAVDLRGHGDSQAGPDGLPSNWRKSKSSKDQNDFFANMSLDVAAAVSYLTGQGVAEEGIGLVGTDVGGSLGLKYAAVHPRVPIIVLFSPGMSYHEVLTVNAMRAYKDRPILMIYSELDKTSSKATPVLYEFAKRSAGERNATVIAVPHLHGVKLPGHGPTVRAVVAWLANPVKPETPAVSTETALVPLIEGSTGTADEGLGPEAPSVPEAVPEAAPETAQ